MTRERTLINAIAAAAVVALSVGSVAGQGPYKVPKTPWGEPDLQGIYNGNDLQGVPMQRAETLGTRSVLTEEEYKQRVANRDTLLRPTTRASTSRTRRNSNALAPWAGRCHRRPTGSSAPRT